MRDIVSGLLLVKDGKFSFKVVKWCDYLDSTLDKKEMDCENV